MVRDVSPALATASCNPSPPLSAKRTSRGVGTSLCFEPNGDIECQQRKSTMTQCGFGHFDAQPNPQVGALASPEIRWELIVNGGGSQCRMSNRNTQLV
jgi:hypothetical protein